MDVSVLHVSPATLRRYQLYKRLGGRHGRSGHYLRRDITGRM